MGVGDVFYGELTLTNYGLVRADNVKQQLPVNDSFFRYEFLADVPETLEAKQRVTIPYRVVALQSLEAVASGGTAGGGGCYSYSNSTRIGYTCACANGDTSTGSTNTSFSSGSSSTCPAGTSGGYGGGGGSGGGFGGGGTSWTDISKGKKCVFIPNGNDGSCPL
jgi:hypothetical protein